VEFLTPGDNSGGADSAEAPAGGVRATTLRHMSASAPLPLAAPAASASPAPAVSAPRGPFALLNDEPVAEPSGARCCGLYGP